MIDVSRLTAWFTRLDITPDLYTVVIPIDGIHCNRGDTNCTRMLDYDDFEIIKVEDVVPCPTCRWHQAYLTTPGPGMAVRLGDFVWTLHFLQNFLDGEKVESHEFRNALMFLLDITNSWSCFGNFSGQVREKIRAERVLLDRWLAPEALTKETKSGWLKSFTAGPESLHLVRLNIDELENNSWATANVVHAYEQNGLFTVPHDVWLRLNALEFEAQEVFNVSVMEDECAIDAPLDLPTLEEVNALLLNGFPSLSAALEAVRAL